MATQNDSTKDFPDSESGYEKDDSTKQGGGAGTATGRSLENQDSTGTAPQNPGTAQQNPGTSGKDEDITGDATERSGHGNTSDGVRNPSGDDLSNAVDGDEGSGRGF
ncbi:MAG: hypothetical protein DMF62_07235 [Acidobacteria bacterium]|nr:MAG: hypothetical protein DMF62_07235 [Acidobacteriota bacterium]